MMKKILSLVLVLGLLTAGLLIARAEGLLTEAQQAFFADKEDTVNALVEEGRLTQEWADSWLDRLEQRLQDGTCGSEECDGSCEPQFNGSGNGEMLKAENGAGMKQNGGSRHQFTEAAMAQKGEGQGLKCDGECTIRGEGECDEPQLHMYGGENALSGENAGGKGNRGGK